MAVTTVGSTAASKAVLRAALKVETTAGHWADTLDATSAVLLDPPRAVHLVEWTVAQTVLSWVDSKVAQMVYWTADLKAPQRAERWDARLVAR